MSAYVRIAVNVPSVVGAPTGAPATGFDYRLPDELSAHVVPGHLVLIPFGSRTVQGVVMGVLDQPAVAETKDVFELVDSVPVMTPAQLALAEWMAGSTLAPISSLLGLFLPPGLDRQVDTTYALNAPPATDDDTNLGRTPSGREPSKSITASRLLKLLALRGPLRGRQIDRALPHLEWRRTAQYLVRQGSLGSHSILPPASVRPKFIRTAQLAVPPLIAEQHLPSLGSTAATQQRRERALRFLLERPGAVNVSWVYAESGCNIADLEELAERDLIILREQEIWRDPLVGSDQLPKPTLASRSISLSVEQLEAWRTIEAAFEAGRTRGAASQFLLQGVTGSGKTEIYIRAAAEALKRGKQAIVLVPEIALTPQTIERFVLHFPGQVGVIHSQLSDGERYDTWRRARSGSLQVIIGPRSALFAPLPQLGLLIVDECHDSSYVQSEPPFFDGVAAAQEYARLCAGICILGSATPSIVQRYETEIGRTVRLELKQRIAGSAGRAEAPAIDLPPVQIVDMRAELRAGNRGTFSAVLKRALDDALRRGEQAILFLNRRGTATYVFCRNCGYVVRCPRCETPLTFHSAEAGKLLCHHCGYSRRMPGKCPECGAEDIRAYGLGTERVEAEVERLFPAARTLRWDWETTRKKGAHEIILHHFAAGKANVLIGTQMLAKGLDLPGVTLVGIVFADVGLFLPDPFAAERTFQVLTQVAGRAGRSIRGGRVVLQTFAPAHYVIQAAAAHDVDGFYTEELGQRRRLAYPPFSHLLRLEYRHHDPAKAQDAAREMADLLRSRLGSRGQASASIIGPAPCFFAKRDGKYRWQVVLRGSQFGSLVGGRRFDGWRVEMDPVSLL